MIRSTLAVVATLLAFSASAQQAETTDAPRPVLKSQATVTGPVVTVGDLVENAGVIAKVAIFRSPDLGFTGTVSAEAVADAVRTQALADIDTAGLSEVTVTRAARTIPVKDIEEAIARALSVQFNLGEPGDITVTFERAVQALHVEPNAVGELRVARIGFSRDGHFDATLDVPTGTRSRGTLRIGGRAVAMTEVLTMARPLERGAILKESDILVDRRPRAEVSRDAVTDRSQAVGLALRNPMQAGRILRTAELVKPDAVQRNEVVMLVYEVPGVTLTVRGKALEGGAEGDTISVLNEQSKRTLQGTIVGPGRVAISQRGSRLAANIESAARNRNEP
jgi:flagella basal body P-ring formation protein FlgA